MLLLCSLLVGAYRFIKLQGDNTSDHTAQPEVEYNDNIVGINRYGLSIDDYYLEDATLDDKNFIGDILHNAGFSYSLVAEAQRKAEDIYAVRKIKPGRKYSLVRESICGDVVALAFEPDPLRFVLYDFRESVDVKIYEREFTTCVETATGRVMSNLKDAIVGEGQDRALVELMEDALASSVSFQHVKKGDEFKVIFERNYIDGKPVTLGKVLGVYWKDKRKEHYSIYYEKENQGGYFDIDGRPYEDAYLLAPVKYSWISSYFSYSRFHPIKKRRIPHLGTDYAARHGDPIRAVSDGMVVEAYYTRPNGKYVKIKHDKTYESQYLHMSRFAKGILPGAIVNKGDVIGYVGSTGLATGPHVCFRFWKNGRQINHLKENFPSTEAMKGNHLAEYNIVRDNIVQYLDQLPVHVHDPKTITVAIADAP